MVIRPYQCRQPPCREPFVAMPITVGHVPNLECEAFYFDMERRGIVLAAMAPNQVADALERIRATVARPWPDALRRPGGPGRDFPVNAKRGEGRAETIRVEPPAEAVLGGGPPRGRGRDFGNGFPLARE